MDEHGYYMNDEIENLDLGKKIAIAREKNGLNQTQLAERLGISPQSISHWEKNISVPRSRRLKELAEILRVPQDYLIPNSNGEDTGSQTGGLTPLIEWDIKNTQVIDWLACPIEHSAKTFALKIKGEAMIGPAKPFFYEEDIIFVDPEKPAQSKSFVVVQLPNQDELVFRQLIIDGTKQVLRPLTPNWYEPFILLDDSAIIRGVVIFKGEYI